MLLITYEEFHVGNKIRIDPIYFCIFTNSNQYLIDYYFATSVHANRNDNND